jgi:hypothetical protein
MRRNTLIQRKEVVIVCEESGLVSLSYNVQLTTLKANTMVKPIVLIATTKSIITCTNCGKTNHSTKTCRNKKREVLVV